MPYLYLMILRRLGFGLLALVFVSVAIFLAVQFLPGDIAETSLGHSATPESVAAMRRELGLDAPPLAQYFRWLGGIVQGDLGTSLASKRPVAALIGARLLNSLYLALLAAAVAIPLAVVLGTLAALYRNTLFDRMVSAITLASISFPEFFVAYILILIFAIKLGVLPGLSNITAGMGAGEQLYKLILPALTLTLMVLAHMMRMTRASIINLLASPYIEMANLKGLRQARIIFRHALPNALSPIITVVVLNLAYLVAGVVVVEVVFVYPGLGQLLVDSVAKRDIPIVQASCMIFAATYIILNIVADVLAIVTNPRLLHPR